LKILIKKRYSLKKEETATNTVGTSF